MEFEAYDINRDGYISMADVPSYVPNPALKMVLISMMTMLPVMDTGRDGRLSQAGSVSKNFFQINSLNVTLHRGNCIPGLLANRSTTIAMDVQVPRQKSR